MTTITKPKPAKSTTDPITAARARLDAAEEARHQGRAALDAELTTAEAAFDAALEEGAAAARTSAELAAELAALDADLGIAEADEARAREMVAASQAALLDPHVDAAAAAEGMQTAEILAKRAQAATVAARGRRAKVAAEIDRVAASPFRHPDQLSPREKLARLRARRAAIVAELDAVDAAGAQLKGVHPNQWRVTVAVDMRGRGPVRRTPGEVASELVRSFVSYFNSLGYGEHERLDEQLEAAASGRWDELAAEARAERTRREAADREYRETYERCMRAKAEAPGLRKRVAQLEKEVAAAQEWLAANGTATAAGRKPSQYSTEFAYVDGLERGRRELEEKRAELQAVEALVASHGRSTTPAGPPPANDDSPSAA